MDDRDHINNKRIEMSGCLVGDLFRTLFKRFVRTIEGQLEKRQDIVVITNRVNMITLGLNHSFATGKLGYSKKLLHSNWSFTNTESADLYLVLFASAEDTGPYWKGGEKYKGSTNSYVSNWIYMSP